MPERPRALQTPDELDVLEQRQRRKASYSMEHRATDKNALIAVREIQPAHSSGNPALEDPSLPGVRGERKCKAPPDDGVVSRVEVTKGGQPSRWQDAIGVDEPQPLSIRTSSARVELNTPSGMTGDPRHVRPTATEDLELNVVDTAGQDDDFGRPALRARRRLRELREEPRQRCKIVANGNDDRNERCHRVCHGAAESMIRETKPWGRYYLQEIVSVSSSPAVISGVVLRPRVSGGPRAC